MSALIATEVRSLFASGGLLLYRPLDLMILLARFKKLVLPTAKSAKVDEHKTRRVSLQLETSSRQQ